MIVVNLRKDKYTHYIGRGSDFGNPFPVKSYGRKKCLEKYEEYARNNPALCRAIANLPEDAILGCYCVPLDCHGFIIIKLREEMHRKLC